jgi:hypothetical protein
LVADLSLKDRQQAWRFYVNLHCDRLGRPRVYPR